MSVFEHIKQAMNNGGFEVLMLAWLGTALIVTWFYAVPILIKECIEKRKENKNDGICNRFNDRHDNMFRNGRKRR